MSTIQSFTLARKRSWQKKRVDFPIDHELSTLAALYGVPRVGKESPPVVHEYDVRY